MGCCVLQRSRAEQGVYNMYGFVYCRDRERNTGFITCTVCLEDYQTSINCILVRCVSFFGGGGVDEVILVVECYR